MIFGPENGACLGYFYTLSSQKNCQKTVLSQLAIMNGCSVLANVSKTSVNTITWLFSFIS